MPYLWMRVAGTLSVQIPILILEGYTNASEVAFYSVGSKFVLPITILITTGVSAAFPFMTKLFMEDIESYKKYVVLGFSVVLIFGSIVASLLTATSSIWIVWIMGERYSSSIVPFNYQVWLAVCLGFDLILSMVFSSTYRQKSLAVVTTIDVVILIPFLFISLSAGASGVAFAKLISSLVAILYHFVIAFRILKIRFFNPQFFLSLLFFVVFFSLSVFVSNVILKGILLVSVFGLFIIIKDSPIKAIFVFLFTMIKKFRRGNNR
jgi:O-antigen/teichoic acid export membrane protein